jgi:hypothetical protein
MQTTSTTRFRAIALVGIAICLEALSGCGDAGMFSRQEAGEALVTNIGAQIDTERATVSHHSTRCGENAAGPCEKGMDPAIEVYIDGHSLIFDFSNVATPGTFTSSDFEGYVLEVQAEANAPILFARFDAEATTLDLDGSNLAYDRTHLEVNFTDISYDRDDFVKIDLLVGPLNLLQHSSK